MNRKRGYLLIILSALLFSTTEVVLKILSGQFAAMQLTALRVAIGALVLLPFALRYLHRSHITLTAGDFGYFIGIGFVSVTVQMVFLQLAVMDIDASAAAILYSGSPIISIFAAHSIVHEPIRRNHVVALSLMLIGILIILDPFRLSMSLRGFAEIMAATVSLGLYGVLCKLRLNRFDSVTIACFALLMGDTQMFALLLLGRIPTVSAFFVRTGFGIFADVPLLTGFTASSLPALLYVGAIIAGAGYFLIGQITRDTSATEASFIYLLKPMFATIIAVAVLHETIRPNRILGIVFYMAASFFVTVPVLREMRREKEEKEKQEKEGSL